ncbi:myogenesis-regulating glycosidase-like [Rhynchophorus ferrugineus]|uniref:myogenesis-regulating glycosidase-like n=1 Tax=Rhynchophorus ferrugineus TaxID=354439 RepID=UPI003FCD7BCE
MKLRVRAGIPTNPPIWWIAPTDSEALKVSDEFLLGDTILVAPVLQEGATSRQVYLPEGTWLDGNDNSCKYEGPISLLYDAPIEVLPYFIRQY